MPASAPLTIMLALLAADDHAALPALPPDAPPPAVVPFEKPPAASPDPAAPGAPTSIPPDLPPELADRLIAMQVQTVGQVRSDTGPFRVRIGGQTVGQRLVIQEEQVPVLGRARVPMDWPEFYQAVGRKDLARAYARRSLLYAGLLVAGLGTSVGSGLFLLAGMLPGLGLILWRAREEGTRSPSPTSPWFIGGMVLIFGGAAAMTVAILAGSTLAWSATRITREVVGPAENIALMEEHNARIIAEHRPAAP